jgi:hypothetical protein
VGFFVYLFKVFTVCDFFFSGNTKVLGNFEHDVTFFFITKFFMKVFKPSLLVFNEGINGVEDLCLSYRVLHIRIIITTSNLVIIVFLFHKGIKIFI